jgi:Fe-Mn family superoxide dismutase
VTEPREDVSRDQANLEAVWTLARALRVLPVEEDDMDLYTLPDLPYAYDALEPFISGEIMQLHHDRHHAAYVRGANETLERLAEARRRNDFSRLAALEHLLAFNVSGHLLHSIFWGNLAPEGGGEPTGALRRAIDDSFGQFSSLRTQLIQAATTITGSGWATLVWDPLGQRLVTAQLHDHQSETPQGGVPLLVIDAWEHAYYLQYRTDKKRFFEALFSLWDWDDVSARFEAAQRLDLGVVRGTVRRVSPH